MLDTRQPRSYLVSARGCTGGILERVMASPPAAVVGRESPFDDRDELALERTAPRLTKWVRDHYERREAVRHWFLMLPRAEEGSRP